MSIQLLVLVLFLQISPSICRSACSVFCSCRKLEVIGEASVTIANKNKQIHDTVYFIDSLKTPLLGKSSMSQLQVIGFIDDIESDQWKA